MSNPFMKATVSVSVFLLLFSRVVIADAGAAEIPQQSAYAVDVAAEGIIKEIPAGLSEFSDAAGGVVKEIVTDSNAFSSAAEGIVKEIAINLNEFSEGIIKEIVTDLNGFSDGMSQQKGNPEGCPVTCFRAAPVCGANGATYWCGSKEAECDGVVVAHAGYCSLGNGGTAGRGLMAGQALLLVHMVWMILAGFLVIFGLP
ncbi:hypothetical protein O6H91_03G013100 [Diphasiastrum complanatum]|uniref:Uncharacterized protein n=2 Tax=Diphasiastrum complanatum TaxID=34168 RepID=A0ACC2A8I6_DIPCM|nr:hypothetical protein O6H91_24G006700 [Diphasiastrum complanatum]KAJ7561080.1 hypothetical protein O6H91_03G013100 [Diphasiastrum complanatum]